MPYRGLPANIQLDIDGDRETERIYSLFNLYMPKLEKMQGEDERSLPLQYTYQSKNTSEKWDVLVRPALRITF